MGKDTKIVSVGGGTGLSNLLRGLKKKPVVLSAIVAVTDNGGSSGRLREELGVLPQATFETVWSRYLRTKL